MSEHERIYKTEAVVLRRSEFGESDYLLTIYTPTYGKLRVVAKGARKPTGRQTGQVELFSRTFLLIHRGRELNVISQADVQDHYLPIQENLERSLYASHFVELLDQFAFEGEENRPAYNLIVEALGWLGENDIDLRLVARYYEYQLLRVMGYAPSVQNCTIGEEKLEAEDQFFSPVDGGVVCAAHAAGRDFMRLSLPVFKVLRHFSRNPWLAVRSLHLNDRQYTELERILQTYLVYLLERRLQSVSILRQLNRNT